MKLSMTLAATALVASFAAPAFAADSVGFGNQDVDRGTEFSSNSFPVGPNGLVLGTTVSTRGNDARAETIRIRNESAARPSDRINADTVTVFSGEPAHGAEIFEELRLADDND